MSETLSREALAGAYTLQGVKTTDEDGNVDEQPFGAAPVGQITYTHDGNMSVVIRPDGDRPPVGYAGGYLVDAEGGFLVHQVRVGLPPVEGDQKRFAVLEDGYLTLSTAAEGERPRAELRWQRVG